MPELSEDERAELDRLEETFGDLEIERRHELTGGFEPIDPMLARTLKHPLEAVDEADWYAEPKYDGTRLIVQKFGGAIRAYTRRGIDRYEDVPEIHEALAALPDDLVLDGELTFVTPDGTSQFHPIHTSTEKLDRRELTTVYYVFDILYDGESLLRTPLAERTDRLDEILTPASSLTPTAVRKRDFPDYFRELTAAGEEGIIIKRRESHYYPGVRSDQWLKVKRVTERDAVVVGYTAGQGQRAATFGALVLSDGERCIGRVGSGFSEVDLSALATAMEPVDEQPFPEEAVGEPYTPVAPFVVSVRYQELTAEGKLRAPVFRRCRPDKPIDDVQPVPTK